MSKTFMVSGVGCCHVDLLFNYIDFSSDIINPYFLKKRGDGGFVCFYMGGTYFEEKTGEKRSKLEPYYEVYRKQITG